MSLYCFCLSPSLDLSQSLARAECLSSEAWHSAPIAKSRHTHTGAHTHSHPHTDKIQTHTSMRGFPAAQMVKKLSAVWETLVQSLGWKDPLEEGMGTHSSVLAWRIPVDRGAW